MCEGLGVGKITYKSYQTTKQRTKLTIDINEMINKKVIFKLNAPTIESCGMPNPNHKHILGKQPRMESYRH